MRHDLTLEGPGCRLRPIGDGDAALVLELRNDPELNRYLHPGATQLAEQLAWFQDYYRREGDYYFVVERCHDGRPEGLIAIYDVAADRSGATWGRWVLRKGSPAAVESAWLIYRVAFERLGLQGVSALTITANTQVVSFHDSCGIAQRQLWPARFELRGSRYDAIEHRMDRAAWDTAGPRLARLAGLAARKINAA